MARKYRLSSCPGRYLTGRLADGRQVLMGVMCPDFAIHYFSAAGDFVEIQNRKLTLPPAIRNGVYFFDEIADASLNADIAAWCTELKFTESPIDVLKFDSDGGTIEDFPAELIELDEEPDNFTDDERDELLEWRADWVESDLFAFWWGDELWIDSDGNVNTS
jgi:hypothetical protein